MRARNKLNVRQLASFSKPGVYSDGGGLYLRVRSSSSRSWLFIYAMHGKRREMGLVPRDNQDKNLRQSG